MSTFQLKINGVSAPLSEHNVQKLDLQLSNLGEDVLIIDQALGEINRAPLMAYGDTVQLLENSIIRFIGTCVTNPRVGLPGQLEGRSYQCRNIIWDLNRIVYEQDWHEDADNTYFKGRVNLGRNADDEIIAVTAAMADVVGYAQNAGLDFTVNTPSITLTPPDQEFIDITCWEAIKNLLIWSPSVATSVDYSSGTPAINFVKRADAASVVFIADQLKSLQVAPRNDLVQNGVVLNYEILNNVDGETYTSMQQDTAGTTSGLNVLRQTINLYGIESSSTEQEIEVVVEDPGDATSTAFWEAYIPGLTLATDLTINSGTSPAVLGSHPNRLVSGQIMDWMDEDWAEAEFTADISFKLNGKPYSNIPVAHKMILTTATTRTYSQITSSSFTPPEDVPVGLAASLLADRSQLHYDGAISLVSTNPDWSANTADVLNMLPNDSQGTAWDDAADWDDALQWLETIEGFLGFDAINAVIKTIRIIATHNGSCTTAINFGPPEHLGPQDFIAMVRASRTRTPSEYSRAEPGLTANGGSIYFNGSTPQDNSSLIGGSLPATTGKEPGMVLRLEEGAEEGDLDIDWNYIKFT